MLRWTPYLYTIYTPWFSLGYGPDITTIIGVNPRGSDPRIRWFGPMLNPTARTRGYIYSMYIHPDPPDLRTPGVDGPTPYTPPEVISPHYTTLRDLLQGA